MINRTNLGLLEVLLVYGHCAGFVPITYTSTKRCFICKCKTYTRRQTILYVLLLFSNLIYAAELYNSVYFLRQSISTKPLLLAVFHSFMCVLNLGTLQNFLMLHTSATELCTILNILFGYSRLRERCNILF